MEPLTQSGLQGTGRKVGTQTGGRDLYGVPSVTPASPPTSALQLGGGHGWVKPLWGAPGSLEEHSPTGAAM